MKQKIIPQEIVKMREKINKIDRALVLFLDKRMEIVATIGEIKKRNNLLVLDSSREKEILRRPPKTENNLFIKNIFKKIFEESRKVQEELK